MALALNSENDIFASDGAIKRVYEGAEVVQSVRTRLLHYLGEWYLDTLSGVDYFGSVFKRPADLSTIESTLKTTIIETPGLESLNSFEMDFDRTTRILGVTWTGTDEYGNAVGATVNETV